MYPLARTRSSGASRKRMGACNCVGEPVGSLASINKVTPEASLAVVPLHGVDGSVGSGVAVERWSPVYNRAPQWINFIPWYNKTQNEVGA